MEYNIYCDESCHLPNDNSNVMVIGGIWIPKEKRKEICNRIREIKQKHNFSDNYEIKWSKVSALKMEVCQDLINYFFDDDDLNFRAIVIQNKNRLHFQNFYEEYDTWYYKMYFLMLNNLLSNHHRYNIYIDIKDTISSEKIIKLHNVCSNSIYDFSHHTIQKIQPIRSEEVEIMQLVDLLIGALSYEKRELDTSKSKLQLIELIKRRSRNSFKKSSPIRDNKFNIFLWRPQENYG